MKHTLVLAVTAAMLTGVIAIALAGSARGEDASSLPSGGRTSLAISKFYVGSLSTVGDFPGTLVRVSCRSDAIDASAQPCGQNEHALVIEGDEGVHVLLPGTDEVRSELESPVLQQTDVRVHGKYYPSTGAILVNRIGPKCEQASC
jgi:hypothetical protein